MQCWEMQMSPTLVMASHMRMWELELGAWLQRLAAVGQICCLGHQDYSAPAAYNPPIILPQIDPRPDPRLNAPPQEGWREMNVMGC